MRVDELNELLDVALPDEDWDTVGGLRVRHARARARGRRVGRARRLAVHRRGGRRAADRAGQRRRVEAAVADADEPADRAGRRDDVALARLTTTFAGHADLLEGKVALVTGASKGIGKAIAAAFADVGRQGDAQLAQARRGSPRRPRRSAATVERVFAANAGDVEAAEACVAATIERFGGLDILVNNAGTNPYYGATLGVDEAALRQDVRGQPARPAVLDAGGVGAGVRATSRA